jgi:hypothetical protein
MRITFQTNLDEAKPFMHSRDGNIGQTWTRVPAVGERIAFDISAWCGDGHIFVLRVCGVTSSQDGQNVVVDLHMPYDGESIKDWSDNLRRRLRKL